ncbi:MAG: hypothetical protein P1U62_15025 [Alteraurantiacibacter sp. bin_em_oilr2.035]|nr:hypothetical protein [Alteraurantiacibacter sp. bin_em_oilr2.035]
MRHTDIIVALSILATLCGCSEGNQVNDRGIGGTGPVSWARGPNDCYWELPSDGGSTQLAAWVLADLDGGSGTALAFADGAKFPDVPIGDDLAVRLIADGDRSRSSMTRGFHPEGQGAYMLSAMLGPSQRLVLSGAREISIEYDGRIVASVIAEGFPTIKELAACDRG